MCSKQHDAVCRREGLFRQVIGIAGRCVRDCGPLGLVLVKKRQRAAARPATENDPLVAESCAGVLDAGAEIGGAFFHDQGGVVPAVTCVGVDDMLPGAGERRDERQEGAAANRVREDDNALGGSADRIDAHAFDRDVIPCPAIDVLEA